MNELLHGALSLECSLVTDHFCLKHADDLSLMHILTQRSVVASLCHVPSLSSLYPFPLFINISLPNPFLHHHFEYVIG